MKKNYQIDRTQTTESVVIIEKEPNGQIFFEVGNEITIDFCEAVAIMISKVPATNDIWNTKIIFDRDINPIKSLYWLTGGHREWRNLENYKYSWSKLSAKFVEKWGEKVEKIAKKAHTLKDVRDVFIKEINFLDIYEFAIKNELVK
jgi:hypothetical protein